MTTELEVEDDEPDEPPVKDILTAIMKAMVDDDDAYRQCGKFIAWRNGLSDVEKEIVDMTLIQICGWSFDTLLEEAEFRTPDDFC